MLILSTGAILALGSRTVWSLSRYHVVSPVAPLIDDIPTVSVCIAARNETHALAQCLEQVLRSDYKKLEILVLDDGSTDDTSLIIKSFANAGVRFIPGKQLPIGWLGKNHAYKTLSDEASGDILLYIDVDTVLSQSSIGQLVAYFTRSKLAMLSVLPRREDSQRFSAIAGTMRYFWELILGTRSSPPAASAIWMVDSVAIKQEGIGLENYGLSVRPERHMARQLNMLGKYEYIVGTASLGVRYEKHVQSQYETALRLYYPMTGRTIVKWLFCTIFLLLLLVPLGVGVTPELNDINLVWAVSLTLLTAGIFGLFVTATYGGPLRMLRVIAGPFLIIQELVLLTLSYRKYRSGTVTWKGRSVTDQTQNHDALEINE